MEYPVILERDEEGAVLVSFPDFPETRTSGEYEADALARAREALAAALGACIRQRRPIPPPSERPGKPHVAVPALVEAKVHVYEAMQAANVGRAELARRLRWHRPQVDRLLNVRHASKFDQLEGAFAALGKRFTIGVDELAPPSRRHQAAQRLSRRSRKSRRT